MLAEQLYTWITIIFGVRDGLRGARRLLTCTLTVAGHRLRLGLCGPELHVHGVLRWSWHGVVILGALALSVCARVPDFRVLQVCVPDWPMFRRNPLPWKPAVVVPAEQPAAEDADQGESKQSSQKGRKGKK